MNKEIKFQMKFDTSEFDRAIEKMQRQLREVYRPADIATAQRQTSQRLEGMGLPGGSKTSNEAYLKSIQSGRREMDQLISKWNKDQQSLLKDIAAHEAKLKTNLKLQESVNKGSEREIQLLREKKAIEENLYRQRETWMARNQTLNQAMDARQNLKPQGLERLMTALEKGGIKGGMTAGGRMGSEWWQGLGMTGQAGMIISGLLAAAGATRMIGNAYAGYKAMPLGVTSAVGSATQNTFGREIQQIYSGNQMQEMAFMPEKQRAAGMAGEAQGARRNVDIATSATGMGMAGLKTGHISNAVVGATLGLINDVFNERSRAYDLSKLPGGIGKQYGEKFEAMQAEEYAQKYAKAVEDLKLQNPLKTAAVEDFAQRREGDLAFQRATGLNYDTFHGSGGFRQKSISAGFTDIQGMQAAQGILGAGGSTRGATGNAVLSMQAQRGMDLTNANEVIGRLSGRMGGSEATNQAFVRMLAEGSRLGLDSSQFREENRRFMDAAGTIIQQSGTGSQAAIENLLERFGGFVGDNKTPAGIQAAKTAFETYNQATSQTQGPQGAMRAAGFISDPLISKMSGQEQSELAGIDSTHMTVDHPTVKSLARKYGVSAQDIVDAHQKIGGKSAFRRPETDALVKNIMKMRGELESLPGTDLASNRRREQMRKSIDEAEDTLAGKAGWELGIQNDPMQARALAEGITRPGGKAMTPEEFMDQQKKLGDKGGTGRPEDQANQAAAASAALMVKAFQQFHDTMVPSIQAVNDYNAAMLKLSATFQGMTDKQKAEALQKYQPLVNSLAPKTQPTGTK